MKEPKFTINDHRSSEPENQEKSFVQVEDVVYELKEGRDFPNIPARWKHLWQVEVSKFANAFLLEWDRNSQAYKMQRQIVDAAFDAGFVSCLNIAAKMREEAKAEEESSD